MKIGLFGFGLEIYFLWPRKGSVTCHEHSFREEPLDRKAQEAWSSYKEAWGEAKKLLPHYAQKRPVYIWEVEDIPEVDRALSKKSWSNPGREVGLSSKDGQLVARISKRKVL